MSVALWLQITFQEASQVSLVKHGRELWWAILPIATHNLMTGCGAKSRSHMQLRLQMLEMVERLMFDLNSGQGSSTSTSKYMLIQLSKGTLEPGFIHNPWCASNGSLTGGCWITLTHKFVYMNEMFCTFVSHPTVNKDNDSEYNLESHAISNLARNFHLWG